MNEFGDISVAEAVRFERLLPGPIERVWEYLTDSEKRGKWFCSGEMERKVGGKVELHFKHNDLSPVKEATPSQFQEYDKGKSHFGTILGYEPPKRLIMKWDESNDGSSEVTFELEPRGEKVLLTITHQKLTNRDARISVCGGWHTHLDILVAHLDGAQPKPFWSAYLGKKSEYEKMIPN
jgi:uncharacterized protein YndB with AHSA1/START domain